MKAFKTEVTLINRVYVVIVTTVHFLIQYHENYNEYLRLRCSHVGRSHSFYIKMHFIFVKCITNAPTCFCLTIETCIEIYFIFVKCIH